MDETLSPTGVILEVLGDLELPIITPIKETGDKYLVMLSLPKSKKYSKDILKRDLESKGLKVLDIDVFREQGERYAWIEVIPSDTGAENGTD